jgi:hypothetical protein
MSALPPKLEQWRKQMCENPNQAAAGAIIKEYFSFFGKEKAGEELWLLTTGTLTNDEMHQAQSGRDRHDLLFFYEFTKMVLESAHYLFTQRNNV